MSFSKGPDSAVEQAPKSYLIANVDGGSRGNPGPAGYGVLIRDESGRQVAALSEYLGRQTNNYAEYSGLIAAIQYALSHGPRALKVISDSELMVRQIRGQYKVNSPSLGELYRGARSLIAKLDWFSIEHVLREQNWQADRLANAAMDKGMGRAPTHPDSSVFIPAAGSKLSPTVVGREVEANPSHELFEGIVRRGVIELLNGQLPEGTEVEVRRKR